MNTSSCALPVSPPSVAEDDWENQLLDWFSILDIPISERIFNLGGLQYHLFSSVFPVANGRSCASHGRSENRKIAAVKCIGEFVERRFMVDWFHHDQLPYGIPPGKLRTSNGWAAHRSRENARMASWREALERHLLIKSYLNFGWAGFRLVETMSTDDLTLFFLISRFVADAHVAGLVVAKSPLYLGVSLGQCIGLRSDIQASHFWESAIFEAVDKIQALNGQPIDLLSGTSTWITAEIKKHLESPFDLRQLFIGESAGSVHEPTPKSQSLVFDLQSRWKLTFPLYAAHTWGGDLIPLFNESHLDSKEEEYVRRVLRDHGLESAQLEHPIL